ncbi:MAG: hypothetical protein AB7F23_06770 [Phycisphaerae bacterium]
MKHKPSIEAVREALRLHAPETPEHLRAYVKTFFGFELPAAGFSSGGPAAYLWHACSNELSGRPSGDCVIWANRGGGKTMLGAAASVLDMVLRPGCDVRILAGSQEQASRMYEYVTAFIERSFSDMLSGRPTKTCLRLINGSSIEVLTQSGRNVRGRHIHKLRCDEVEMFDRDVFEAAQYITRSEDGRTAAMELASTMHRPYGLMRDVVARASSAAMPLFRWNLWDVIERCRERSCSACPLSEDCRGVARKAGGHYRIDDAISQFKRSSRASWEAEVLCKRPLMEKCVFAEFDAATHIRQLSSDISRAQYRTLDFGYVNPFVCLWIELGSGGEVYVLREYVARHKTSAENAREVKRLTHGGERSITATFCDPAGKQRTAATGTSAIDDLRREGVNVRCKASRINDGLELIRAHLRSADGTARLFIDPSCKHLIEAMECYHYPENTREELPEKDGLHDHYIDALRYFFINLHREGVNRLTY